ncbi:Os04g0430200, partial [Oryza sativa Japonica Group]
CTTARHGGTPKGIFNATSGATALLRPPTATLQWQQLIILVPSTLAALLLSL